MLTIEKVIKLLDDNHLSVFKEYLKKAGAEYPLQLVNSIDRNIPSSQRSSDLCEKVYGNSSEKNRKKFFQLAHHTFRMTFFLSKNYPHYILTSIGRVQYLFSQGKPKEANAILNIAKELAEKIEDFKSLIIILEILSQQAHINESFSEAYKYQTERQIALNHEIKISQICSLLNQNFHPKQKPTISNNLEELQQLFQPYLNSDSFAVKILGKYAYCYAIYFQNRDEFYAETTFAHLLYLENQLKKYNYILLPYLDDLSYKVGYLKIRHMFYKMKQDQIIKESKDFLTDNNETLFWNSFINTPELFSISFQTSFYVTQYLSSYKSNHLELVPNDVLAIIEKLKKRAYELINNPGWNEDIIIKLINLKTIYSMLLLLGNKEDIKLSVQNLESMLVEYQQIPFHFYMDGIFSNIVIGYFCLKDYGSVSSSYKRYKKISEGKAMNEENDITIHGFYYASQWVATGRKQYATKFANVIQQTHKTNLLSTQRLLLDLAEHVGL